MCHVGSERERKTAFLVLFFILPKETHSCPVPCYKTANGG